VSKHNRRTADKAEDQRFEGESSVLIEANRHILFSSMRKKY
jgi:hypothetical protein